MTGSLIGVVTIQIQHRAHSEKVSIPLREVGAPVLIMPFNIE